MTAGVATASAGAGASPRWFFGPVPDLLFGCGLVYGFFFTVQTLDGDALRTWLPLGLLPVVTLLLGAPHYGATLLRVYGRREDRQRYALFAVWVTLLLFALFVAGLHVVAVGSLLVTLYFTWSPWHYAGQNYGLAVLFLRRRGVALDPTTKRLMYGSFGLSYVLIFLTLHTAGPVVQAAPATLEGTVYRFFNLGIPRGVRDVVAPVLLLGYAICVLGPAWRLRRTPWRDLLPSAVLVGLQGLWFGVPAIASIWNVARGVDPFDPATRPYTFMWIATGHFVQYLWITTYYAAASEGALGRLRYLAKTFVVGVALWTLPAFLFAPDLLGRLPYDLGLALLAGSVVNVHHFVLDGAIWKLRDGRVARALLRPVGPPSGVVPGSGRTGRGARAARSLAWATGAAVFGLALFVRFEQSAGERAAEAGDMARVQQAVRRLERVGWTSPTVHVRLAQRALRDGNVAGARRELERAATIYPTAPQWTTQAAIEERRGDWRAAADAYEKALALDPQHTVALVGSGRAWLRLGDEGRARKRLERALVLQPVNTRARLLLESLAPGGEAPAPSPRQKPALR